MPSAQQRNGSNHASPVGRGRPPCLPVFHGLALMPMATDATVLQPLGPQENRPAYRHPLPVAAIAGLRPAPRLGQHLPQRHSPLQVLRLHGDMSHIVKRRHHPGLVADLTLNLQALLGIPKRRVVVATRAVNPALPQRLQTGRPEAAAPGHPCNGSVTPPQPPVRTAPCGAPRRPAAVACRGRRPRRRATRGGLAGVVGGCAPRRGGAKMPFEFPIRPLL
jgi:hypothetical protein